MIRCYLSGNEEHDRVIRAFAEGCKGELVKGWAYKPSEVAVIFGVYKSKVPISYPRGEIFRRQREQKLDVVVLETGYINRGSTETNHYAAGFNGLNGRADFRNKGMPPDRAEKLGVKLKPWKLDGKNIILCGQVPWDAQCEGTDHIQWLEDTARKLLRLGRPVVFRPHPLGPPLSINGCLPHKKTLKEDLEDAYYVVTFNSNSAVEAVIEGIPVTASDEGSMALAVTSSIASREAPDRQSWLNDLAYTQWTPSEMREGLTWRHLSR